MLEKLFPLDLPPGFQNNGTTYQSKGRWHAGNLVRFFQGNKQPVGGWVQRTTTGATITGTPNAAISWQLNTGASYLAIGTTSNLYVVDSANVVYDITPVAVTTDGLTHRWQLEVFGSYLIACFNSDAFYDSDNLSVHVWKGVTTAVAIPTFAVAYGPNSVYGVVVTPERYLMLLRGADPFSFPARTIASKDIFAP